MFREMFGVRTWVRTGATASVKYKQRRGHGRARSFTESGHKSAFEEVSRHHSPRTPSRQGIDHMGVSHDLRFTLLQS